VPGLEVGEVIALSRFPVKSMLGERLGSIRLDERGVVGDRLWAVRTPEGKYGAGKSTPRFRSAPGLKELAAEYDSDVPCITFPDGTRWRGDDPGVHAALSTALGKPVQLAREGAVSLLDAGPGFVHLLSTGALEYARKLLLESDVDERRFRPNILLAVGDSADPVEESWVGRTVGIGTARLLVAERTERCVMVNHERAGLPADGRILRALAAANDMRLGVYAKVTTPGTIHLGDRATLD